jgi:hypothetical protein
LLPYADQNERDSETILEAVRSGRCAPGGALRADGGPDRSLRYTYRIDDLIRRGHRVLEGVPAHRDHD